MVGADRINFQLEQTSAWGEAVSWSAYFALQICIK